jgi:predicted Kef-type K+ transport protein
MKKRRAATTAKNIYAFVAGLLLLAGAYYLPFGSGFIGDRNRAQLAGIGVLLVAGTVWVLWRGRR